MIILVLVVIAGYLVWLRSRSQAPVSPAVEQEVEVTPTAQPEMTATPSATPGAGEATKSGRTRTATPSAR